MGKGIFVLGSFLCCVVFLCGCSMMPNDDEIINWSISESEIFSEEEMLNDESNQEVNENIDDVSQERNDEDNSENEEKDLYTSNYKE